MREHDCDITYYQVQAQYTHRNTNEDEWFLPSIAEGMFGVKNKDKDPTACGNCWQKTGIHGVYTEEAGITWLEWTKRKYLNESKKALQISVPLMFRLVKVHSIKTTEIIPI